MTDWLTLVQTHWLTDLLLFKLTDWLTYSCTNWLTDWLILVQTRWLTDLLLYKHTDWLTDVLIDELTVTVAACFKDLSQYFLWGLRKITTNASKDTRCLCCNEARIITITPRSSVMHKAVHFSRSGNMPNNRTKTLTNVCISLLWI
jgi:hypothetical protein